VIDALGGLTSKSLVYCLRQGEALNGRMSPKRVVLGLWVAVIALAAGFFLSTLDSDYREFAPTQVGVAETPRSASAVVPAPSAAPAAKSEAKPVSAAAAVSTPAVPVISLNTVAGAMLPAAPEKQATQPAVAVATAPVRFQQYRPAYLATAEVRAESAAAIGGSKPDFLKACDHDHDLHLAAGARPTYFCRMPKLAAVPQATPAITSTPSYPTSQTFLLHSRPGATRRIYLDFTGHTTTGTPWNDGWNNASFTTPPWSIDDDTTTFNAQEHAEIQDVWRRMAEDFAGFDVDVTTEEPTSAQLLKTAGNDTSYGMRVIFGRDQNNTGAGGIAYLNSFGAPRGANQTDIPCYVFADSNADAKFMTEAGSHEVGHTVGLFHDGATGGLEYFGGHGTGANSWAPIMGVGYYRNVSQWSKGEYTNANQTQDDLQVISTFIPYAADDHGDTRDTATFASGTTLSGVGIIGKSTDADLFQIRAGRGNLVITPKVALFSPNLRLQVRVLDSTGTAMGTFTGDGTIDNLAPGTITVSIPQDGAYFIELTGTNQGDGLTQGYTRYGSLGYYTFEAEWSEFGNRRPVANATRTAPLTYNYVTAPNQVVTFDGTLSTDPDGSIVRYSWDFKDVYPRTAEGATVTHRYNAPGVYYPVLTVTDNTGATGSTTVTVNVTGTTRPARCYLSLVSGTFIRLNSIHDAANVTIEVRDQYGNPLRGSLVDVAVSGLARAQRITLRTDIFGRVNVNSPAFRRGATGSLRFDVTRVASQTHPYDQADNLVPSFVLLTR